MAAVIDELHLSATDGADGNGVQWFGFQRLGGNCRRPGEFQRTFHSLIVGKSLPLLTGQAPHAGSTLGPTLPFYYGCSKIEAAFR